MHQSSWAPMAASASGCIFPLRPFADILRRKRTASEAILYNRIYLQKLSTRFAKAEFGTVYNLCNNQSFKTKFTRRFGTTTSFVICFPSSRTLTLGSFFTALRRAAVDRPGAASTL